MKPYLFRDHFLRCFQLNSSHGNFFTPWQFSPHDLENKKIFVNCQPKNMDGLDKNIKQIWKMDGFSWFSHVFMIPPPAKNRIRKGNIASSRIQFSPIKHHKPILYIHIYTYIIYIYHTDIHVHVMYMYMYMTWNIYAYLLHSSIIYIYTYIICPLCIYVCIYIYT